MDCGWTTNELEQSQLNLGSQYYNNYVGLGGLSCLATNPCRKKWDGSFCGYFSSEEILLAKDFAKGSILGRKWKWLDKH